MLVQKLFCTQALTTLLIMCGLTIKGAHAHICPRAYYIGAYVNSPTEAARARALY